MRTYQKNLGDWGEKIAEKYLVDKGYQIISRNYRKRVGEIDLVARQGHKTIFVEVKTRTSSRFGFPEQAIDQNKLKKLSDVIEVYLAENKLSDNNIQLDCLVVEFIQRFNKVKIRHLKNIEVEI